MITFLFIVGLAALLVVGGVKGSLRLHTHRMSTGRRLSGLRRSYATPMNYTTQEDKMSGYSRKVVIILILILVVIILSAINAVIH